MGEQPLAAQKQEREKPLGTEEGGGNKHGKTPDKEKATAKQAAENFDPVGLDRENNEVI